MAYHAESQNNHRIVVASIKGGTGKTTTAVALAAKLAQYMSTLIIDFDAQAQVCMHFGKDSKRGVFDWLVKGVPYQDCLLRARPATLSILPGNDDTRAIPAQVHQQSGAYLLSAAMSNIDAYNFVVVDTAAGGILQEAALNGAAQVIVPFRLEGPSIRSLRNSLDMIKACAPSRVAITLLPVGYDKRLGEHKRNLSAVVDAFGAGYGLSSDESDCMPIYNRVAVAEAFSNGQTIWEVNSDGIQDVQRGYTLLAARVCELSDYDFYASHILQTMN